MAKQKNTSDSAADKNVLTALAFLQQPNKHLDVQNAPPVIAVFGDEPFLRSESIQAIRQTLLPSNDGDESGLTIFSAEQADFSKVKSELSTVSMFGPQSRLIIVQQADAFITANRDKLEDLLSNPPACGTLVLEIASFPTNTRIYKVVAQKGMLINCKSLTEDLLGSWLVKRATFYKNSILREAADLLIDKIGTSMGLLDQELVKLGTFANGQTIDCDAVNKLSGSWRAQTAWDMLDNALAGQADKALQYLDSLLSAGEQPIVIVAQLSANLRKLAMANRLYLDAQANGRGISFREAIAQAGVKTFVLQKTESQIRRLGIERMSMMLERLTQLDFDLKGDSRLDSRTLLERFLLQLC